MDLNMKASRKELESADMAHVGTIASKSCRASDEASEMQQSLESAQAALQSSSIPAQLFGTEMLLDVARTAAGKRLIVSQGALSSLCDGMADGRIKSQAFKDGLKVLETVAVGCTAACESGHACGMPSACVNVMLAIFGSSTQPHEHRLQAGRVAASLLNFHKCQRTALREGGGFDSLATQLKGSKEDKAFVHLSLEVLARAVRNDGHCKAALAEREDILQSVAQLLAFEQMAPPALIAVVALLCCAPGMHALSRQCCGALCRAGIAPPLVGLLASEPDSPRCTEVLEIARRLASSGPEGLAALRDAGMLQACLFIIESAAPGSHNAKCAVNLVGRSAEWDESSRRLLEEKQAHSTLLQALHVADFEELPLKYDICEVLSKLGSSDPDSSSTGGKRLLHWSAQYGDAELCERYLRSYPLVDPQDERGNTPLHLAVCNDRRDAVELLLDMNASTTITNKARQTPRDLAIPQTDVWALLDEEAEWRSLLEMQRPCRVRLVGWEGPSECTFCPTLGVLRLRGLSDHIKASVPQMRRLLRPRKTPQPGSFVVSVPLPHTAVISQPRALEVHINFNGLDHVLGQTLVPSSSDGRVTVVELWLCTDSSAEADSVEKALKRLQLRIYPDIIAFGRAYAAYSQMYEQCKANQIDACTQYGKMYLAIQAGHATSQLGQQLEELWQQVEEGRNAVIDAHQGLLDMADGAIARLTTMRVECEKAAESAGGDALWELLGDRALATLHLVRAYRERALRTAYSGLLPPQPHHSSDDSEGPAGADSMDQLLSGAGASAKAPPLISTDRELIIAAKALSLECKEALAQPRAHAGSSRLSVHTAVSAAPVDLWSSGSSRALPTEEPQACSGGSSPVEQAQLADAVPHGDLERGLMAPTPPQKAQRRPRRSGSSGSPSEDNLSMTGLMDSGSEVASNKSISKGSRTSSADTEVSLHSSSDDSQKGVRHVDRFLQAAAHFAMAAMATYDSEPYDAELYEPEPGLPMPMPQPSKPGKSRAARRLSTETPSDAESHPITAVPNSSAAEPCLQEAAEAAQQTGTPRACTSPQADFGMETKEPCSPFQRQLLGDSQKEWRRSGSFTFPRTPPRSSSGHSEDFTFRRATASEPCEAIGFPRLARQHPSPLSHHASLAKMASVDNRPGSGGLPDPEEVRQLLETGESSQWRPDPTHANMAQVLTHEVDVRGPAADGMAELSALLGSADWAPLDTSAQAALAQASSAMAPADYLSGRPPLPDSRPRHPKPAASATPPPNDTRIPVGLAPGQEPLTRPSTPGPLDSVNTGGQSRNVEHAAQRSLPNILTEDRAPLDDTKVQEDKEKAAGRMGKELAKMPMTEEGKAEFVKILTAKIAEAAQQVALGAISSSVNVAGEAVKDAPSWAGPDVIIATTMDKLDHIVAAANAQLASAIESGVAQAAALASTMSADDLANKWQERKQRALPSSPAVTPGTPAGSFRGSPSAAKGPISARFPSFAEHGRKALAGAKAPTVASSAPDSSGADKNLHASGEAAALEQERPSDAHTEEDLSAVAEQSSKDAAMADAGSAPEGGAESDASTSSNDARLRSPAKKAKQVFPGPQKPTVPELQLTKTQDLVPLVMDPFGQAAMSAMAMQEGSFGAGVYSSAGSMGKVSPRRRRERGRMAVGRSRQTSVGESFSAMSTGASSMSSSHLAAAGRQFENALLDSNCSGLSE